MSATEYEVDPVEDDAVVEQARFERAKNLLERKGWQLRRCDPSGYYAHCRTRARFMADIVDLERLANVAKKQHSEVGA